MKEGVGLDSVKVGLEPLISEREYPFEVKGKEEVDLVDWEAIEPIAKETSVLLMEEPEADAEL